MHRENGTDTGVPEAGHEVSRPVSRCAGSGREGFAERLGPCCGEFAACDAVVEVGQLPGLGEVFDSLHIGADQYDVATDVTMEGEDDAASGAEGAVTGRRRPRRHRRVTWT